MLMSKEDLINEVIDILANDDPMSATAISKEIGYTKLNARVLSVLNELILDEEVKKEQTDGGYYIYSLNPQEDDENIEKEDEGEEDEEDEDNDPSEPNDLMPQEIVENNIPIKYYDYEITALPKNHAEVVFPELDEDGEEKSIVLEPDERLLVINQNAAFRFVVQTPEDILEAIHIYTTEMKITTYLVTDMATGVAVSDVGTIDMGGPSVLFLEISRHNKAGK